MSHFLFLKGILIMNHTSIITQFYKKEIIQSDGIEKIPPLTYAGFSNLEQFVCSVNLKEIAELAFVNCKSLEEIQFNENLEHIGKGVFGNCWSLKQLDLSSTKLKSFNTDIYTDNKALFYGYGHIKDIIFPVTVESIEGMVTTAETSFEIPNPETVVKLDDYTQRKGIIIIAPVESKAHEYAVKNKLSYVELSNGSNQKTAANKSQQDIIPKGGRK